MSLEKSIGTAALSLGMFTLGGLLASQVGSLGGLALGGFHSLIVFPIAAVGGCGAFCVGKATGSRNVTIALAIAAGIASIFVGLYCSQLICNTFDTLPSFSYTDALTVLGHVMWMTLALSIIRGCCLLAARGCCFAMASRVDQLD